MRIVFTILNILNILTWDECVKICEQLYKMKTIQNLYSSDKQHFQIK